MDSSRWHAEPIDWATYAYELLAPRVNVQGRMALLLLLAVIWAFSWYVLFMPSVPGCLLICQASMASLFGHHHPERGSGRKTRARHPTRAAGHPRRHLVARDPDHLEICGALILGARTPRRSERESRRNDAKE